MARFFVSYSRSVKSQVQKIVDLLLASGHEVWWDVDIPATADWWSTILDHIEWCEVFIYVASTKSVESIYCISELRYANDLDIPVLPFILDGPEILILPDELPKRSQWLIYNGVPTDMLEKINNAYLQIEWHKYSRINAPRPIDPSSDSTTLAMQYHQARQLAMNMEFRKSKQLLRSVKQVDFDEWGQDCDEWLKRITAYEKVKDFVEHENMQKALKHWYTYETEFTNEFDPYGINHKLNTLRTPVTSINFQNGILLFVLLVIISMVAYTLRLSSNEPIDITTSTPSENQTGDSVTAEDIRILSNAYNRLFEGSWQADYTINARFMSGAEVIEFFVTGTLIQSDTTGLQLIFNSRSYAGTPSETILDMEIRLIDGIQYQRISQTIDGDSVSTDWVYTNILNTLDSETNNIIISDSETLEIIDSFNAFNLDPFVTTTRLNNEDANRIAYFSRNIDLVSILTSSSILNPITTTANITLENPIDSEQLIPFFNQLITNSNFITYERVNLEDNSYRNYQIDLDLGLSGELIGSMSDIAFTLDTFVAFTYDVPVFIEIPANAITLEQYNDLDTRNNLEISECLISLNISKCLEALL